MTETARPPLIPREVLFGNPRRTGPQLSPNGRCLAYLAPDERNVLQVWLRTVEEGGIKAFMARRRLRKIGAQTTAALGWRTIIGKISAAVDWRN